MTSSDLTCLHFLDQKEFTAEENTELALLKTVVLKLWGVRGNDDSFIENFTFYKVHRHKTKSLINTC